MALRIQGLRTSIDSIRDVINVDMTINGTIADKYYNALAEMEWERYPIDIVVKNNRCEESSIICYDKSGRTRVSYGDSYQDRTGNIPYWIEPTKVIFNGPATIVFWNDNTKTVVKCQCDHTRNRDHEKCNDSCPLFDKELGFAMACAKKLFGNKGSYYNKFKEVLKENNND